MELPVQILLTYGYYLLFGWVFAEQMGVPLPAAPVLLAAGALSAEGEMNFGWAFMVALVAAMIADLAWFFIGRRWGRVVMRFLCKVSLEPTNCLRKTELSYSKRRDVVLLFAKFVPGLATLAPPVAGQHGMGTMRFVAFDGMGSALWVAALLAGGRFFGVLLNTNPGMLNWVGHFSAMLLGVGIGGFLLFRIMRRVVLIHRFVRARVEPAELKQQMDEGEPVTIVDLRACSELVDEPHTLPGALRLSPEELSKHVRDLPQDQDVVVFCSCPSETGAAAAAIKLHKLGLERVRPLRGGIDAWRKAGFPMEAVEAISVQK